MKTTLIGIPALTILSACISLIVTPAWADDLTVFSNGKVADANDVNANFNELETRIKTISLTPGETGAVGAQGIQGSQGFTGAAGANGAQGIQGLSGNAGTNGVNGAVGAKGDAGVNGAQGLSGDAGADGVAGAQGIQGLAGADSIVAGADGADGADGIMYDGAFEGDMQYWNGNAWMMITAPTENADSLSFCDGQPTWTQGGCPVVVVYEVGDTGPAGGIVFYVSNEGLNGLEAAPADQDPTQWGCYSTLISGAYGTVVGTGEQNTADIMAGCNETTAASVASAYGPGWYLPSKDELNLLYLQKAAGVVGGFARGYYWSSSQVNAYSSWFQFFHDGLQYDYYTKASTLRVRAVRAF
jgi:hypothetical protein